jgi:hypothetical protein
MKKVFSIIIIVVCIVIYYSSNNAYIMEKYTEYRTNRKYLGSDKVGYGGLYGMCYLTDFRVPFKYNPTVRKDSLLKNIDLYIFSDSYLYYAVNKENFVNINQFNKIKYWELGTYMKIKSLDTSKINILVIEMTERYVRSICTNFDGIQNMLLFDTNYTGNVYYCNDSKTNLDADNTSNHWFNPNINSNLELNLFDYGIFRPFKELKAELNYYVFKRKPNDVFVDTAKRFLYYQPTVEGEQNMNSFYPVDSNELKTICSNINKVYTYYKSNGFDQVYLSIIPNPVTMINPTLKEYNRMIPLINDVDTLKMPIINVYNLFKTGPERYYSRSDSHWSNEGLQKWLDHFNEILMILKR